MLRILHVVTKMDMAGLETMIMNYYRKINRSEVQFDFMVHRKERGAYDDEIESLGGIIYRMPPIRLKSIVSYRKQLKEFFSNHAEYKIVHSHLNTLSTAVLRYARLSGIPVRIAHSHTSGLKWDLKAPVRILSKTFLARECNYRMACSQDAGHWLFGSRKNFSVIKNAIDLHKYVYNSETDLTIRRELGIANQIVLGHIGRFDTNKNQVFLIDILERLVKSDTNYMLVLVGEGPHKDAVLQRISDKNLDRYVRVLSARKDVHLILQCFNIFLFPSRFEGLGMALVEAQASGLPCIASDSICHDAKITDLVELLPLDDISGWTSHILEIRKSNRRYERQEVIKAKGYDIKENSEDLIKAYQALLTDSLR